METLGGFPNLPALWLRWAKPSFAYAIVMETLAGFPNLPALWLRWAVGAIHESPAPAYAYAILMEPPLGARFIAPGRFPNPWQTKSPLRSS
jgi:hypothetical protein